MNFAKLNQQYFIQDYTLGDFVVKFTDKLVYFDATTTVDLFKILPESYRDKFVLRFMRINDNIYPHTDSMIVSTINFYISAGNYKTIFYNIKDSNPEQTLQIENQTNGRVFKYEALEYADSFEAKVGDAYLLDVTKPHSVESEDPKTRIALCLQSYVVSFDEIKDVFVENGLI